MSLPLRLERALRARVARHFVELDPEAGTVTVRRPSGERSKVPFHKVNGFPADFVLDDEATTLAVEHGVFALVPWAYRIACTEASLAHTAQFRTLGNGRAARGYACDMARVLDALEAMVGHAEERLYNPRRQRPQTALAPATQ